MGSSMVTEVVPPEDDGLSMPPPRKILKRGTQEHKEAMRKGEIKLSLPFDTEQQLVPWQQSSPTYSPQATVPIISNNVPPSPEDERKIDNLDCSTEPGGSADENIGHSIVGKPYAEQDSSDEDRSATSIETNAPPKVYDTSNNDPCRPTSTKDQEKSRVLVSTRFSDVIGHGAVKLRLDEVLLPLALPRDLADSILTGTDFRDFNVCFTLFLQTIIIASKQESDRYQRQFFCSGRPDAER
jgi:hypothetical protein